MPTCTQCSAEFEVTHEDIAFLKKLSPEIGGETYDLPPPELCFYCRLQRRLVFHNARSVYKRSCSKTGNQIISMFSPDKPYTVYNKELWYSDSWDATEHGRDFDFNRPFFDQWKELRDRVPLPGTTLATYNVNSDYVNDAYRLKNCYLIFDGEEAEDCYYGQNFTYIKSSMDFYALEKGELCYECVHCYGCYNCKFTYYSHNCTDCFFVRDCIGCKYCFGCVNLHQKQYCIWNEQKTKEEYEEFMNTFHSNTQSHIDSYEKQAKDFFVKHPVKLSRGVQNVDSTGDNINQCKNSKYTFNSTGMQDCRYCSNCLMGGKDCMDVYVWGEAMELCYDSTAIGNRIQRLLFCNYVYDGCTDCMYSMYCTPSCSHLFGCISMRRSNFCILNKQYTEEEYKELVPKIIKHMKTTGEWGQFFPAHASNFGYNETLAQSHMPSSKEEAHKQGFSWSDFDPKVEAEKTIDAMQLPDSSDDIPDDVLNWAIMCKESKKPFKIIQQELDFYRNQKLPIPRLHPDVRHARRMEWINQYKLWNRTCAKCSKDIQTTYSPERPEIVYCEECYLKEVY